MKDFARNGGAVYDECGGFMYLTEKLTDKLGRSMNMCGIIPAHASIRNRLSAFGYREAKTCQETFPGQNGTVFRGHEFHWLDTERR